MVHSQKTLHIAKKFETLKLAIERENRLIAQGWGYDDYCMELEAKAESVYLDLLDSIENDKISRVLNK